MAPSVKRRLTSVDYARQIISAITSIRQQKQIPNFERISRYIQRCSYITTDTIQELLNSAVSDGLIMEYTAVGTKGQRTGLEQEGYRIVNPDEAEQEEDEHDWYCFECHGPGEVYLCSGCFRVYHKGCTKEDTTGQNFTCSVCMAIRRKNWMKKKMVNTLLSYTISRIKEKTRELYRVSEKTDDVRQFVRRTMDLNEMEHKVQTSRYKCFNEFLGDAETILHNCALIYGEEKGGLTELAFIMVRDCKHELDEIEVCPNCYYMSHSKPEDWFSQPCNPPHELVYAKQKGYCYWPAKVVKDLNGKYDVRFFGGWHQRAVIPADCVKPISTNLKTLTVKKSAGFLKSMMELKRYEQLLKEREQNTNTSEKRQSKKDEAHLEEDEPEEDNEGEMSFEEEDIEINQSKWNKSKTRDSSQTRNKKPVKRKKERKNESECELEGEAANRQVTSTSIDKHARKHMRHSSKNNYPDETNIVTSSIDKNVHILTVSQAVQTFGLQTDSVSTQTDLETKTKDASVSNVASSSVACGMQQQLKERMWEESMVAAMTNLTRRLERKFEENKKLALKELSQQLEEDFGKDKQQAVERTLASMKLEVEKARKAGEDSAREQFMEEMKKLSMKHKEAISQIKRKQWCQYCDEEAMYHCCWSTSYCSVECQQEHWHKEHKRVCGRKRT